MKEPALFRILKKLSLFRDWPDEALRDLIPLCSVYPAGAGETLLLKGEPLDSLWIPLEGRWSWDSRVLQVREPLAVEALQKTAEAGGTLRAESPGLLLSLSRPDFQGFLRRFPSVLNCQGLPRELRQALAEDMEKNRRAQGFVPLEPGERVLRLIRPSGRHLAAGGIGGIILSFLAGAWLFHGMASAGRAEMGAVLGAGLAAGGLLLTSWVPFRYLKELLILTDRAVILNRYHYRGFRREVLRFPLEEIQLIRSGMESWRDRFLGLCYAEAVPAGGVGVRIRGLARRDNPEADFRQAAEEQQRRKEGQRRMRLREMVQAAGSGEGEEPAGGEEAVYGKSRWVLLRKTLFPLSAFSVLTGAAVFLGHWFPAAFAGAALAVLLWRWEDWRNDRFLIQGDVLVDWDSLPLGLRERKSVMPLAEIQEIRSEQRGIGRNLLGIGDVVIQGAAAGEPLIFEDVASPWQVQQDIFLRRRRLARREEERQRRARQQEWTELMGVYGELKRADNGERWKS